MGSNRLADSGIYHEIEGEGDPVLLIPGWAGTMHDLGGLRSALAPHYRVIAVDAPGAGRSGPQPRTYTASYLMEDAHAFMGLLETLKSPPVHVVGFSDGGEYAFLMAETRPAMVRSIVAWGAAGQFNPSPEFVSAWADAIDNPIPEFQDFSLQLISAYGEANARHMIRTHAAAMAALAEAGGDVGRRDAGSIACPALLMAGENDFWASPAVVADMANAMQKAEFVEVAGAGHAVHRDRPEWLAQRIIAWLADH